MKLKTTNILLYYSLYSLLVTVTVSICISFILVKNIEIKIINAHSDLYKSFVEAIPENYSEIVSELTGHEDRVDYKIEEPDDHQETEHQPAEKGEETIWRHFQTDLMQIPSVQQLRVFDSALYEKWYYRSARMDQTDSYPSMIRDGKGGELSFHIMTRYPLYVIHFYIPISYRGNKIGIMEITDIDKNLDSLLKSSRNIIFFILGLGSIILYATLFTLFSRSYRDQKTAIDRLDKSQSITIHTMSLLAELRDKHTGTHIIRTSKYCALIARALQKHKAYSKYIDKNYIEDIERSAPLHDIGKVGIPDSILNKPGKLTAEEFEIIKKHPEFGAEVLKTAINSLDFQNYFEIGMQVVLHHHENWTEPVIPPV